MNIKDYQLKTPVDYKIQMMWVTAAYVIEKTGIVVLVIGDPSKTDEIQAISPTDEGNLSRCLDFPGYQILGRGILAEKVSASVWYVAWRSFYPAPHIDDSNWEK